jgi:hypothetical protein
MKRFLALAILFGLCFTIEAQSATQLAGFLGIKWSDTRETAVSILSNRDFKNIESEKAQDDMAIISCNGSFAGRECSILLLFYQEKFYDAVVTIRPDKNTVIREYKAIVSELANKYGDSNSVAYSFKSPYFDGDGYEETAIALNKATISSLWRFYNDKTILVAINKTLAIVIYYTDGELYKKVRAIIDQQNSDDF